MLQTFSLLFAVIHAVNIKEAVPPASTLAEAEGFYNGCGPCRPRPLSADQIGCALYDIDDRLCNLETCVADLKEQPDKKCRAFLYGITNCCGQHLPDLVGHYDPWTTVDEIIDTYLRDHIGDEQLTDGWQIVMMVDNPETHQPEAVYLGSYNRTLESIKKSFGLCPDQDVMLQFKPGTPCCNSCW